MTDRCSRGRYHHPGKMLLSRLQQQASEVALVSRVLIALHVTREREQGLTGNGISYEGFSILFIDDAHISETHRDLSGRLPDELSTTLAQNTERESRQFAR